MNYADQINHLDLSLFYCGSQECTPGHTWGPAVKEHYKIHFVHKGKGIFKVWNQTYHLQEGDGFLICPGIVSYYRADDEEPWTYSWIAFDGLSAQAYLNRANLSSSQPIFHSDKNDAVSKCIKQMLATSDMSKSRDLRYQSFLYLFMAILIDNASSASNKDKHIKSKEIYVHKAVDYMQKNYSHKISISEMADSIGVDKKYLSAVFKDTMGVPPQNFLIDIRMNKACELMEDGRLSIGDIARSVGYSDPLVFSRMFHKTKGVSPRDFRNSIR